MSTQRTGSWKFFKFSKKYKLNIQCIEWAPTRTNLKKSMSRHIILKLAKTKGKKKTLRVAEKKQYFLR